MRKASTFLKTYFRKHYYARKSPYEYVYSVRIEPTKMISVGTRITYQATGDAGQNAQPNMAQHWYTHTSCLRSLGTYGLLIVRVCTLLRSSYSSVRWKDEAPTKLMQKIKNKIW